jgi:hypothetical protein
MLLSCRGHDEAAGAAGAGGAVLEQLRGVPEGSALSSYFVLMKQARGGDRAGWEGPSSKWGALLPWPRMSAPSLRLLPDAALETPRSCPSRPPPPPPKKKQGNDFTALPVDQMYGFRPVVLCVLLGGGATRVAGWLGCWKWRADSLDRTPKTAGLC